MQRILCAVSLLVITPLGVAALNDVTSVGVAGPPRITAAFSPAPLSKQPAPATGTRWPARLSANAMYGSVWVGGHPRPCVIDRQGESGYTVRLDLNGNNDLTDERAVRLERHGALLEATLEYGDPPTPLKLALVMGEDGRPAEKILQFLWTERRGTVKAGGRDVLFALIGSEGRYDDPRNAVFFDLNGDGALDTSDRYSSERVEVGSGYVVIDGAAYEFAVEPHGDFVNLKGLLESRLAPPSLEPGAPAPDFAFQDLVGVSRRLSDYRGQILLLYFWGTWCPACRQEIPELVKAYAAIRDKGFVILGINSRDDLATIIRYSKEHGIKWTQSMQGEDGPILQLYRVNGYPTSFLLSRDGRILMRPAPGRDLARNLKSIMDKDPGKE